MTARLVLLGASNVRRGLPVVVESARAAIGPDLEIFGAFGHGRSYGTRSCIPFRCLPGILECGLWEALAAGGGATSAVVMDVGNDILYGETAETILGWVAECLARLARGGAALRVVAAPVDRIRRVAAAEFLLFRTIFYPGSRVSRRAAVRAVEEVDAGLRRLASGAGAAIVEPRLRWYGMDPIHIRRSMRPAAWAEILGAAGPPPPMPAGEALRLRLAPPERRWIAGFERRALQPALRLKGETLISLF
ncbi:MAG TPA: hypothetical protein VFS34_07980 [Thermoanaerobaculia bacterium]|nr:hypothetical protein [Thermoanaerobaculia bacterium]